MNSNVKPRMVRPRLCRTMCVIGAVALLLLAPTWSASDETIAVVEQDACACCEKDAACAGACTEAMEEPALRYLPDECRLFAQMNVGPILKSEFMQELSYRGMDPAGLLNPQLASLGVKIDEVERVFLGARSISPSSISQYVAVAFCKKPIDLAVTAASEQWRKLEIGSHTVWDTDGNGELALCVVEGQIILAGELSTVRTVLLRDGPARLPEMRDTTWTLPRSAAPFTLSILPPEQGGWAQAIESAIQVPSSVLESVWAIGAEVRFQKDLAVTVSALCADEKTAKKFSGMVSGVCALVQLQETDQQNPQLGELMDSFECDVNGQVVTAQLTVPNELVQVTPLVHSMAPQVIQPYAVHGAPQVTQPFAVAGAPSCCPSTPALPSALPYPAAAATPATAFFVDGEPGLRSNMPRVRTASHGTPPIPTLKIADVMRLVEAGVDDAVISRHIRRRQLDAHLTVDDLILLTEGNVSAEIITALQDLSVANQGPYAPTSNPYAPVPSTQPHVSQLPTPYPANVQYFAPGPTFQGPPPVTSTPAQQPQTLRVPEPKPSVR